MELESISTARRTRHDQEIGYDGGAPNESCPGPGENEISNVRAPKSSKVARRLRMVTACDNCHTNHRQCTEEHTCAMCDRSRVECTYSIAHERKAKRDARTKSREESKNVRKSKYAQSGFGRVKSPQPNTNGAAGLNDPDILSLQVSGTSRTNQSLYPGRSDLEAEASSTWPGNWAYQACDLTQESCLVTDTLG